MRISAPVFRAAAYLLSLTVLLFPMARLANAAPLTPLLESLYKFRIENFIALNAYYNYSANGDKQTLDQVNDAINQSNALMNEIPKRASSLVSKAQISKLTSAHDKFKKLMNTNLNDVRKKGYPDLQVVSEMANDAQELNKLSKEIYDDVKTKDSVVTDKYVEVGREASLLLAQMMTKYSARSSSSTALTFQGADTDIPLDKQAEAFDKLLAELDTPVKKSKAMQAQYDEIATKWAFIRSSYINYNENNVAFVINRYSNSIIRGLENIAEELAGNKPIPKDISEKPKLVIPQKPADLQTSGQTAKQ